MTLYEKVINDLQFKTKKNNSLVYNIQKLKYQDLISISNVIDNSSFLNEFSSGWNSLHYATINNELEVLYYISNLYIKNKCDLNQKVKIAKNNVEVGDNAIEIAIKNQSLKQFIILSNLGLKEYKKASYFMQKMTKRLSTDTVDNEISLPYEKSIINLFINDFSYVGLSILNKDFKFDEKKQYIHEFMENHIHICNFLISEPLFKSYENFLNHIAEKKIKDLDINVFDLFSFPFLSSFNLNKNQMPYSLIRNFDLYYKDSPDLFLIDLQQSKLQTELINCFKEIEFIEINSNTRNLKNFFDNFQLKKIINFYNLNAQLNQKNLYLKPKKI